MRTPAAASLALALLCLLAAPTGSFGKTPDKLALNQTPAVAADDFPALRPIARAGPPASPSSGSAGGVDERVLIAALYWLAIGGLVLRRRVSRGSEEPVEPVAGWVLAYGPPLPR